MKQTFTFHSPPTIHFGIGALAKIKEAAPVLGKKALIISDETMRKLGHLETCQKHLNQIGVSPVIYDSVNSEPTDQHVAEAVQLFKRESCQSVLSLGGGSCIVAAKAVAILATNPLNVADLMDQRRIKNKPVSHIALPTTAGTGSEVTDVIVITHTDTQVKLMMKHSLFVPEVAIVDPKLTLSCPETVVAGTGIDAFCHAIEAYLSKKSHPMTNLYALSAMELIINNLQSAYDQPTDLKAKEAMSLAALQAGLAFSNASVCLIH